MLGRILFLPREISYEKLFSASEGRGCEGRPVRAEDTVSYLNVGKAESCQSSCVLMASGLAVGDREKH